MSAAKRSTKSSVIERARRSWREDDSRILIYELPSGKLRTEIFYAELPMAWSADEVMLAYVVNDTRVRIWDVAKNRPLPREGFDVACPPDS